MRDVIIAGKIMISNYLASLLMKRNRVGRFTAGKVAELIKLTRADARGEPLETSSFSGRVVKRRRTMKNEASKQPRLY